MVEAAAWAALGGLGAVTYLVLSWPQIHTLSSIIDEGLYLYKGYLFSSGLYVPFQDAGPWTNHMPLSFLIPGWVQAVFGLGIRTGRFYALVLGMLMVLGVWINARRLGGLRWAAVAVWLVALNSFSLDVYNKAQSQVLIACMLAWVLVFTLGKGRPLWQVLVGSVLAGATLSTRINMLVLLPLMLGYIFWEHGWRTGVWATLASLSIPLAVHVIYWPDILKLWAKWLPDGMTPFLAAWRELPSAIPAWNPGVRNQARLGSLRLGLTQNPGLLLGSLAVLLTWPQGPWSEDGKSVRRVAVFLLLLVAALTGLHAWAALGNNYCVYCFTSYLAFFSQLGIYLLVLAGACWYPRLNPGRRVLALLLLLLVGVGLWATSYEGLARQLRAVRMPRMAGFHLLPGATTIAGLLKNLLGVTAEMTQSVLGLLSILGVLAVLGSIVWLATCWARRRTVRLPLALLATAMGVWMAAFSLGYSIPKGSVCTEDVIGAFEKAGRHLSTRVPPGSTVFWAASASPAPLLYLPQARIFPAQLNGDYTYRLSGDPRDLERFGSWNAEMASRWLTEADYVLVYQRNSGVEGEHLDLADFEELLPTPLLQPCQKDSFIRVFRRIQ